MSRQFGEKLRLLRRYHGITQAKLADQLGLASHVHITKLETNQDVPSLSLVIRIAAFLNTTTDYLLRDTMPIQEPLTRSTGHILSKEIIPPLFGRRLHELRVQHELSQTDLARHLGLARRGYISNLEAGRKLPSLDLVVQIADFFGVTTEYLLRESTITSAASEHLNGEASI